MTVRIRLTGGPLHGHHWEDREHPVVGPAPVLKLKAPPEGLVLSGEPVEPMTHVRYATYRLVPGGGSSHEYQYDPTAE
jgi:hypothetical protein